MKMRSTRMGALVCALVALGTPAAIQQAFAANIVVPGSASTTEGAFSDNFPLHTDDVTAVVVIASAELAGLHPGFEITALSWRLDGSFSADQPEHDTEIKDLEIHLGRGAVNPDNMQTTVADNYLPGTRTQVFDDKLKIKKETLSPGSPADFEITVTFDTPYVYTGGPLVLEYTHKGSNKDIIPVDALATTGLATINQMTSLTYQGTTVAPSAVVAVPQLTYVPEPEAWALTVFGVALCLRRRRLRKARWR